jgi:hypothetical protein
MFLTGMDCFPVAGRATAVVAKATMGGCPDARVSLVPGSPWLQTGWRRHWNDWRPRAACDSRIRPLDCCGLCTVGLLANRSQRTKRCSERERRSRRPSRLLDLDPVQVGRGADRVQLHLVGLAGDEARREDLDRADLVPAAGGWEDCRATGRPVRGGLHASR